MRNEMPERIQKKMQKEPNGTKNSKEEMYHHHHHAF
jgi:hypothetical protein